MEKMNVATIYFEDGLNVNQAEMNLIFFKILTLFFFLKKKKI